MASELQPCRADFELSFSLAELSLCCGTSSDRIVVLVHEGVLNPHGQEPQEWRFAERDMTRAVSALRLERDLGVNVAGAALAVELLEEMQRLRNRVRLLESMLSRQ